MLMPDIKVNHERPTSVSGLQNAMQSTSAKIHRFVSPLMDQMAQDRLVPASAILAIRQQSYIFTSFRIKSECTVSNLCMSLFFVQPSVSLHEKNIKTVTRVVRLKIILFQSVVTVDR